MLRHIKGLFGLALALVILSLIFSKAAMGQTGTTSLRGIVLDKSGAVVVGAAVKLAEPSLGVQRATVSNSSGEYEFLSLQPGSYSLGMEAAGVRRQDQKNIQLLVNMLTTANVTLQVGSTRET